MAFWRRIFGKPGTGETRTSTALGKMAGDRAEALARGLFLQYKSALLSEPPLPSSFASNSHRLTATQREIVRKLGTAPAQIISSLGLSGLSEAQEMALAHLIRNLVLARIACMVEQSRNAGADSQGEKSAHGHPLVDMEPMGNA